jgi:hypothetical protein
VLSLSHLTHEPSVIISPCVCVQAKPDGAGTHSLLSGNIPSPRHGDDAATVFISEFLTANPEVPGSIPGATVFSELQ